MSRCKLSLVLLLAWWGLRAPVLLAEGPGYLVEDLEIGTGSLQLHWGRRDADERLDLFALEPGAVRIWQQGEAGFKAAATLEIKLPQEVSLVGFGDVAGDIGVDVVLLNRRGVHVDVVAMASPDAQEGESDGAFRRLLSIPGIPVGLEHAPSSFVRDLTGDGRADLVIPIRTGYEVFRRTDSGFERIAALEGEHKILVDEGGPSLLDPLRFEMSVPQLKLKDLNGDGRLDISSRVRDRTRCYLQGDAGFHSEPSYELDLARFREGDAAGDKQRGARKRSGVGLTLNSSIKLHEVDIDGDRIQDYLIGAGQHLRVYYGSATGADFSRPHTMLKLSNELQGVGSFDIDQDGRLDLVALKFELPGLPKLIAAYFVSMSLDFEVLGYKNEGGRKFSRLPAWRNTLALELPPLRDVLEGFDAFAERFLEAASRRGRFAAGDVNGDGVPDAAFLDPGGLVRVYFGQAGGPRPGNVRLGNLLFDTRKGRWELQELLDFVANASLESARAAVVGRKPDREIAVGPGCEDRELTLSIIDLNADGQGDFVLDCVTGKLRVALSRR